MVVLRPRIPKDSKAAPAPVSLSKRRQAKAKKIREEGAVNGKIRKRYQRRNLSPTRKCPFDTQKAYADQCDRCAITTLNHFNQLAASKMGVTYELVKAGRSTGFMHREQGLIFHCNFLAKPIKCSGDSETVLFFGEVWEVYPNDPVVTNCCILGSVDTVCLGNNGCGACCPDLHHPAEGFYAGEEQHGLS